MESKEYIEEIDRLRRERGAIILAHNYQRPEIQEIADFTGDSLELARKSASLSESLIVFCGVRFMAETAKLLAPQKTVLLPSADAGCFMADMITAELVRELKAKHPRAKVVTYVNSNVEVKAETDVCCTSANAVKVVNSIDADEIIFLPDRNLGAWCQKHTKKKIILPEGFCPVHERMTLDELLAARAAMPDAPILVHPECKSELQDAADEVLSTSQMLSFAKGSKARRFLIATEIEMLYRLRKENPDKEFFTVGAARACVNMKKTGLKELRDSLAEMKTAIEIDSELRERAKRPLDAMVAIL